MPEILTIQEGYAEVGDESFDPLQLGSLLRADTETALPDGTKFIEERGENMVVVHQQPPHVRVLRWISDGSRSSFGSNTSYMKVRLAFPYTILVSTFRLGRLQGNNELYFSNETLTKKDQSLSWPCLLNVSVVKGMHSNEKTWVCTQHYRGDGNWAEQLNALVEHVWNGGFNRSSEAHEGASWFGRSSSVLEEVNTVQSWEEWSLDNPNMATEIEWLDAERTVADVIEEAFSCLPQRVSITRYLLKKIKASKKK